VLALVRQASPGSMGGKGKARWPSYGGLFRGAQRQVQRPSCHYILYNIRRSGPNALGLSRCCEPPRSNSG
jgi:hypothetical protein